MRYHLFFLLSLFLISCQEEITLELQQEEIKLVVEGYIEPGYPPYVILTKNQGYFDPINTTTYNELFVNNVDSINVWYFDESGLKVNKSLELLDPQISAEFIGEEIPLYTIEPSELIDVITNPGNYDFSKEELTYYLEIKWENQLITAQTFIPKSTPLDCLWVTKSETDERAYKCDIRAIYSDPPNQQNNILIKSKRLQHYSFSEDSCKSKNNEDQVLRLVDSGSDILINGQTFETYFPRPSKNGNFPTGKYNSSHYRECSNGDTLLREKDIVLIKFCQIDEPSMKFWRGLVRQGGTNGNPFAEPANLVSNINGGLGIWTGYSPAYYKVPIVIDTSIFGEYNPEIGDIF
tara:strand:- start:1245 stop:2291 length:1047 start_codon:yes stop_codon:yes gene_type:complete